MRPAGRADVYTMKHTHRTRGHNKLELRPEVNTLFDSAGLMVKTPYDLAVIIDVIADGKPNGEQRHSYTAALDRDWRRHLLQHWIRERGSFLQRF